MENNAQKPNTDDARLIKTDFSKGPVWKAVIRQAIPLTVAQLIHLLYNVVDRVYIGHMGDGESLALTGVGLTFPIVTLLMAFAALFGVGGVPLFSMARGAGDERKAGKILGNAFALLCLSSLVVAAVCYAFMRPILFAFGASEASFAFAREYLNVYLLGTTFTMLATGLNGYINAQGFPRIGMLSIVIGAVLNIALDPVFIFALRMGVRGAAVATVISQAVSAAWILRFFLSDRALIPLRRENMRLDGAIVKGIAKLGTVNFIMQGTNCLVQVVSNATLQKYGGDLYVGVMTVTNSVREIFQLAVSGLTTGALPVISFNYGAKLYDRVKKGIRFNAILGASYTVLAWIVVFLFPRVFFGLFSDDPNLIEVGSPMLKIYFFAFMFMSFQHAGQSAFQAVGDARHAITFSLLRKAVIVVPLTVLLPRLLGVSGVFWAEPISNVIGGTACFVTMYITVYRKLGKETK